MCHLCVNCVRTHSTIHYGAIAGNGFISLKQPLPRPQSRQLSGHPAQYPAASLAGNGAQWRGVWITDASHGSRDCRSYLDFGGNCGSIVIMKRRFVVARIVANAAIVLLVFAVVIPNCIVPSHGLKPEHIAWSGLTFPFLISCIATYSLWFWNQNSN